MITSIGLRQRRATVSSSAHGSATEAGACFENATSTTCTRTRIPASATKGGDITPVWGQNPHELWVACQGRARRPASSRYGERLLTDPDDRLCNPLLGEPAANVGEELGDLRWRRRAPVVEIPATVALLADSAALAPQSLGEQNRAQLVSLAPNRHRWRAREDNRRLRGEAQPPARSRRTRVSTPLSRWATTSS